jgi:hypothetical protein
VFASLPWEEMAKVNCDFTFLIYNDASNDETSIISEKIQEFYPSQNILVLRNKKNIGYGGIQKLGLTFAKQNNFDFVILLHGDGQYSPKLMLHLLNPGVDKNYDLVLGSRMKHKMSALKGGMPIYKWIGNIILTKIQNFMLGSRLTEFHTGYRMYSKNLISKIMFESNSNYYDFDTQVIIQALEKDLRIFEVSIPTIYRGEVSHLNGIKYSIKILKSTIEHSKFRRFKNKNKGKDYSLKLSKTGYIPKLLEESISFANNITQERLVSMKIRKY